MKYIFNIIMLICLSFPMVSHSLTKDEQTAIIKRYDRIQIAITLISKGKTKATIVYVEKHKLVKAIDPWGNNLIHWSALYGNKDLVIYFIKNGVDKNLKNSKGNTPKSLVTSYYEFCINAKKQRKIRGLEESVILNREIVRYKYILDLINKKD